VTAAYKILFTVTLRHDYYTNKACNDFTIKPTPDCIQLLNQYHLIFRQAGNKIIILTPAENDKPSIEISPGIVFRFYLFCENVYFTHFTNWDQDDYSSKKFYATNQYNNFSETNRYLTTPLSVYDDKVTYHQGNLVINAQKEVIECLQENPAGAKSKPLSDKNFWKQFIDNKTQYCTTDSLVDFTQNLLPFVLIQGAKIKVEAFDNLEEDFKKTIFDHIADNLSETVKLFSSLPAGRYKLTVNANEKIIYYDPDTFAKKSWGIIEIHHQDDLSKEMQILDGDELPTDKDDETKLTPRNFIIHFRNRSVLWKYNLRLMKDDYSISDSSANKIAFEKKESAFISKDPIPLSEEPIKTFVLKKDTTALIDVLKNPVFYKLNTFEKPDPADAQKKKMIKYLCSEMYLTI
jgi:hypothetical protein